MEAEREALDIARVRAWLRNGRAREVRKRAGLSQADVAAALGTDTAQVSRWETRKAVPVRDSALRLARLYEKLEEVTRSEAAPAGTGKVTWD